jgi:hypothetical protein
MSERASKDGGADAAKSGAASFEARAFAVVEHRL